MRYRLLGAAATLAVAHAGAGAQEARPEDVATIDGIILAYYEVVSGPAGESADVARDRTLHHPDAWIAIAGVEDSGKPFVRTMDLVGYHGDNAPREEGFWEWETDRVTQRFGNMVHVWSSYATARTEGGEPYARGVNSITLFHDGERWWVMGWMFDGSGG
ncbi:MAG: hypothetical protein P8170_13250 [Gemmatimonadota bacterium]|jgi:hypothetical protein